MRITLTDQINSACDELLQRIINDIEEFQPFDYHRNLAEQVEEVYDDEICDIYYECYDMAAGASKIVLLKDDFVVKMCYDEEAQSDDEDSIYQEAKYYGLDKYFAETIFVKEDPELGIRFTAQKHIAHSPRDYLLKNHLCSQWQHVSKNFSSIIEQSARNHNDDYFCYLAATGRTADIYKLRTFFQRLHINDLHRNNFIVDATGTPILIDYAGFEPGLTES